MLGKESFIFFNDDFLTHAQRARLDIKLNNITRDCLNNNSLSMFWE